MWRLAYQLSTGNPLWVTASYSDVVLFVLVVFGPLVPLVVLCPHLIQAQSTVLSKPYIYCLL
jgi:hypothetical protein